MATIKKNKVEYDLEKDDIIVYDGYNYVLIAHNKKNELNLCKILKSQVTKMIKDKEIIKLRETYVGYYGENVEDEYIGLYSGAIRYSLAIDCEFVSDCEYFYTCCEDCKHNPLHIDEKDEWEDFHYSYNPKRNK